MTDIFKQLNEDLGLNVAPPDQSRLIWKFTLTKENQTFQIPAGAEYLSAAVTADGLSLWFLVNPLAEKITRRFTIAITGKPLPAGYLRFITTVVQTGMTPKGPRTLATHIVEVEP